MVSTSPGRRSDEQCTRASPPGYAATLDRGTTANRCGAWVPTLLRHRPAAAAGRRRRHRRPRARCRRSTLSTRSSAQAYRVLGRDRAATAGPAASAHQPARRPRRWCADAQPLELTVGETWSLPTWIAPAIAGCRVPEAELELGDEHAMARGARKPSVSSARAYALTHRIMTGCVMVAPPAKAVLRRIPPPADRAGHSAPAGAATPSSAGSTWRSGETAAAPRPQPG